jgi:hypothetical protein
MSFVSSERLTAAGQRNGCCASGGSGIKVCRPAAAFGEAERLLPPRSTLGGSEGQDPLQPRRWRPVVNRIMKAEPSAVIIVDPENQAALNHILATLDS